MTDSYNLVESVIQDTTVTDPDTRKRISDMYLRGDLQAEEAQTISNIALNQE